MSNITEITEYPFNNPKYRFISLTRGQRAIVDASQYEELSKHKWFANFNPGTKSYYAARHIRVDGKQKRVYMAREILGLTPGDGVQGDHRRHNTLDNRLEKLRDSSPSQNSCNRRLRSDSTSGYTGVSWNKKMGKFRARIVVEGKFILLGWYVTAELAAEAYNLAAICLHGEFATLNVIKYLEAA